MKSNVLIAVAIIAGLAACENEQAEEEHDSANSENQDFVLTVDYSRHLGPDCELLIDAFAECESLVNDIASLSLRYGPSHPDVWMVRQQARSVCCAASNQQP